ncbi:hypothetical protein Y032_0010g1095 [Ancylostoma ceylanicum]|uniref:Uncharacterized protein n=1 Tax=Ancylostoma ceylanicum TaxID=53326 RepID=A0A016VH23_9BILA|nr:hypothetical protein Y032_0010g1095 [Ancylostoma ceylanicum]
MLPLDHINYHSIFLIVYTDAHAARLGCCDMIPCCIKARYDCYLGPFIIVIACEYKLAIKLNHRTATTAVHSRNR